MTKNNPNIDKGASLKNLNKRPVDNNKQKIEIIKKTFWATKNGRSTRGEKNKMTGGGYTNGEKKSFPPRYGFSLLNALMGA